MTLPKKTIFSLPFILISLLYIVPLFTQNYYKVWQLWLPVLSWFLGALVGFLVLEFDRIVDVYIGNPDTELSRYVKNYFKNRQLKKGWLVITKNKVLQQKLTFHSLLFQIIWILLALFTLTSTSSPFGKSFIMGLGLHLILEQWQDWVLNKNFFTKLYFWQINRELTFKEIKIYLWIITIIVAFLFIFMTRI
ncbi:hypothetical protein GYA19_05285 [Candidatus Beckwithbacteria bacterium]|nr:hypothetical protein [Candidatus Beckwithbacteria bacterium]